MNVKLNASKITAVILTSTVVFNFSMATANAVTPVAPPGVDARAQRVLSAIMWGVTLCAVAGLLIIAGKMLLDARRGHGDGDGGALGKWAVGCIIAASASGLVQWLML